jgi:glycosyltransferase involved in cell wall biosynthesis
MEDGMLKILLLAGSPRGDDGEWPLAPLLNRLEKRRLQLQVLRLAKGHELQGDPRVVESPALTNRWLRPFLARRLWSDSVLERPDLVHVVHDGAGSVALSLCETAGLPYIQSISSFSTLDRGLRLSRRWCRGLVAGCPDIAHDLVVRLRVPAHAIVLIPPGIAAAPTVDRDLSPSKVPVIGTGGASDETSGMLVFLTAARMVIDAGHDVEFVVGGHDQEQALLRHHAQRLNIADRVTVADRALVGGDLWTVSDIYCQPSVNPSSGRMLLQAFAHGVPCVATSVKGLRSLIVPGETGLIVPVNNPGALAQAMVTLLDQPETARRLGRNAIEHARARFDPDVEADRLENLYRQVAGDALLPEPWTNHSHQNTAG